MGRFSRCVTKAVKSSFFVYETPKMVEIESKFIGVLHKLTQLVLLIAVVVWVFVLNNGHQYFDNGAIGGITNKIKGVAYSNSSDPRVGRRIWDSADLHVPPQDDGAFFLTTNVILTKNQTQGECASLPWSGADCETDEDCLPIGKPFHLGHGVSTGECDNATKTCVVEAWCPLEDDSPPVEGLAMLQHTAAFTVFIKNHVFFPYYNKTRSNMIESIDKKYLRSCRYHPQDHPYCPIFRVGDIVSIAETKEMGETVLNDSYFETMAYKGGVISINIKWDCNFDYPEEDCKPEYQFTRLDNYKGNTIAQGYNFRYPLNYIEGDLQKRQLIKAYGILFALETDAVARAFDIKTFMLNVGSSLALLGIASVLSDIALLHLHRNRSLFKKVKTDHQPRVILNKKTQPKEVYTAVADGCRMVEDQSSA